MQINLRRDRMEEMAILLDSHDTALAARIRHLDAAGQERLCVAIELSPDEVQAMKLSGAAKRMI